MEDIIIDIPSDHIVIDVYDEDTLTFITYMYTRLIRGAISRGRARGISAPLVASVDNSHICARQVVPSLSVASLEDHS